MDWRGSRQKLENTILDQAIKDREAGRYAGMSRWDLEEMAREKAARIAATAKNRHEMQEAERRIRRGEAL